MTERDKIAARIRALLAKTVENGCTEEEAIAAAAKAAEMLERYNLTVDEVELRASPFERHTDHFEDEVSSRLWKVADAIAYLTGARYWTSRKGIHPVEINFFGFKHEVEVATYLLAICHRAMQDGHKRVKQGARLLTATARRRRLIPFLDGMADSLSRRIRALKPAEPTGTGLVVLRNQLIDKALADAGIKINQQPERRSRDFEEHYAAGVKAGERVALNRGLESTRSPAGLIS